MIRVLAWTLACVGLLAGGCYTPTSTEPAAPKFTGAGLGRSCAAWTDEPKSMSLKRTHKTRSIHAGIDHGCAAIDNGKAVCWGWNEAGGLVGGDREFLDTPAYVRGLDDVVEVDELCARTDHGTVYCWDSGPLDGGGRRLISDYLSPLERARIRKARAPCGPVRVPNIEDAVQLAVGGDHACVVQGDGRVSCWGDNSRAQLGRWSDGPDESQVPAVVPSLRGIRQVAAGTNHTCALLRGGKVVCWGDNERGQIGVEGPRFTGRPYWVRGVEKVVEISAAEDHTCARHRDGTVRCWGDVGFTEGDERETPGVCMATEVPNLDDAVELGAGGFDCARRWNGKVVCWDELDCGHGEAREAFGSGKLERIRKLDRALEIDVGHEHACARRRGGRVWCWGEARSGGLGSHAPELALTADFEQVPLLRDAVGSGRDSICGLDKRGRLRCSTLGTVPPHGPSEMLEGIDGEIVELVQAPLLDCARTRKGDVHCWGTEGHALPVSELEDVDRIYPLWSSAACAHEKTGETLCWGAEVTSLDSVTQTLTGDVETAHWHAEAVDTPVEVVRMVIDHNAVCGMTPDDRVVCWPLADSDDPLTFSRLALTPQEAALVEGETPPAEEESPEPTPPADASEPEPPGPNEDAPGEPAPTGDEAQSEPRTFIEVELSEVTDITAASRGFCARTETGAVACWQASFDREEASGPIVPIPVTGLVGIVDWERGALSSEICAITADGLVQCFDPNYDPVDPPVEIPTTPLEGIDAATGLLRLGGHPCALRSDARLHCWGGPFRGAPLSRDEGLFVEKPVPIPGLGRGG